MPFNSSSSIWGNAIEHFFRDRVFEPVVQEGPHCVSTALAVLTGTHASYFLRLQRRGKLNTQDPVSWSEALQQFSMKLAYVPFDVRMLGFYMDELVGLDDLFLLCYYTRRGVMLLRNPDEKGWVCGSHVVVLHRDRILDPRWSESVRAFEHPCNRFHTKRLFRVVPLNHARGL